MSNYLLTTDERMESISRSIDELSARLSGINERNRKIDAFMEKCWTVIKIPCFCLITLAVVGTIIEYLVKSM